MFLGLCYQINLASLVSIHCFKVLNEKLTYMTSCICPNVRLPLDQHNLFSDGVKKCIIMATLNSLLTFCTA